MKPNLKLYTFDSARSELRKRKMSERERKENEEEEEEKGVVVEK